MGYKIPAESLDRLDTYVAEDRIIRGSWVDTGSDGRERACLLAALDPDTIAAPDQCPAEYLPPWYAHMTPNLDDHVSAAAWPEVVRRWQTVARHMHRLTPEGAERAKWLTIDASLAVAQPHDTTDVVAPVRALIARQLAGDPPSSVDWGAAEAADASAADAPQRLAVWAALDAARSAARAAEAAWDEIADVCLTAMERACGLESVI